MRFSTLKSTWNAFQHSEIDVDSPWSAFQYSESDVGRVPALGNAFQHSEMGVKMENFEKNYFLLFRFP